MTGLILAGGRSSRMGVEKAFLQIAGRPLIEHIIAVFSRLFERTFIVTKFPERYRSCGVDVLSDEFAIDGPLTGIYTGLLHSQDEYHFVSACDMPYLNAELVSYLMRQAAGYDAVVPLVNGFPEPLHAVYHRRLLEPIRARLLRSEKRLTGLFDDVRVRYVTEDEIKRFDPSNRSFVNVNTPEEYKEAVCSDSACRN